MNTAQLLEAIPVLSPDDLTLLSGALSTRGKHAGRVRATAPNRSTYPRKWGAWQSVVSTLAPMRINTASLMMEALSDSDAIAAFHATEQVQDRLELICPDGSTMSGPSVFRALVATTEPLRWNADYTRYDLDKFQAVILELLAATAPVSDPPETA